MNVRAISGVVTDSTGGLIVPRLCTADVLMCYVTALAELERKVLSEEIYSSLKRKEFQFISLTLAFLSVLKLDYFSLKIKAVYIRKWKARR